MSVSIMPGRTPVDANAFRRDLAGEADGKRVDGALGGGIVDILARAAEHGRHGGNIDDGTAAPAVTDRHAPDRLGGAADLADHIDGEHPLQPVARHVFHTGRAVDHAGIVDQAVQPAELSVHACKDRGDTLFRAGIALNKRGLSPVAAML